MASVELETGRPRGRPDLSNEPAVLLAKAEAALTAQIKLADLEQVRLSLSLSLSLCLSNCPISSRRNCS
jgi:hypothetical protein